MVACPHLLSVPHSRSDLNILNYSCRDCLGHSHINRSNSRYSLCSSLSRSSSLNKPNITNEQDRFRASTLTEGKCWLMDCINSTLGHSDLHSH